MPIIDKSELQPEEPKPVLQEFQQEIIKENKQSLYPSNIVRLPSKGLLYSPDNPLSQGTVEVKFMTAKEEDILTTESYIKEKVVLDKFFQSMIIGPKFDYDSLLLGDKDAIMVACRIYGYGPEYETTVTTPSGNKQKVLVNLEELENKEFDESLITPGENRFEFRLPNSQKNIEFKLLTVSDQKQIDNILKRKQLGKADKQVSARLKQMILSVDGNEDRSFIALFVENDLLSRDARSLREYVAKITPGVNMEIEVQDEETGEPFRTDIAIGLDFFWPDVRV